MIMRITWGKVQPGMWPEYADAYRQTMEPISSGIQGLRGRWLAHDLDEADAGFAVSIWDSQADLDAYRSSELFEQQARPRSATTSSTSSAPTTARSTSSRTLGSSVASAEGQASLVSAPARDGAVTPDPQRDVLEPSAYGGEAWP